MPSKTQLSSIPQRLESNINFLYLIIVTGILLQIIIIPVMNSGEKNKNNNYDENTLNLSKLATVLIASGMILIGITCLKVSSITTNIIIFGLSTLVLTKLVFFGIYTEKLTTAKLPETFKSFDSSSNSILFIICLLFYFLIEESVIKPLKTSSNSKGIYGVLLGIFGLLYTAILIIISIILSTYITEG